MTTVFDVFREDYFIYLEISRGEVYGNRIVSQKKLRGVVKIREGMTNQLNREDRESNSTVHVHPENFAKMTREEIIGNGIRYNDTDYSIVGMTEGKNFDTGTVEHLTLTLERANFTSYKIEGTV